MVRSHMARSRRVARKNFPIDFPEQRFGFADRFTVTVALVSMCMRRIIIQSKRVIKRGFFSFLHLIPYPNQFDKGLMIYWVVFMGKVIIAYTWSGPSSQF